MAFVCLLTPSTLSHHDLYFMINVKKLYFILFLVFDVSTQTKATGLGVEGTPPFESLY